MFRDYLFRINFRYLRIECEERETSGKEDSKVREMYLTVMRLFSATLQRVQPERKKFLKRQRFFINKLVQLVKVSPCNTLILEREILFV